MIGKKARQKIFRVLKMCAKIWWCHEILNSKECIPDETLGIKNLYFQFSEKSPELPLIFTLKNLLSFVKNTNHPKKWESILFVSFSLGLLL